MNMLRHWEYIIARDHKGWDGNGDIPAGGKYSEQFSGYPEGKRVTDQSKLR